MKALKSKELSEGQFEDMYAKEADAQLASVASNKFSQLARIIVRHLKSTHENAVQSEIAEDVIQPEVGQVFTPGFVASQALETTTVNVVDSPRSSSKSRLVA